MHDEIILPNARPRAVLPKPKTHPYIVNVHTFMSGGDPNYGIFLKLCLVSIRIHEHLRQFIATA